jgi:UDP-N-acetylmuramate--alanine ligase
VNENADFSATNLEIQHGRFYMDVHFHNTTWKAVELGLPGIHNAENALACIALCLFLGVSEFEIRTGLRTFLGVKRRFEYKVRTEKLVYIDDYAHHPTEISALVRSVRLMYPKLKITGIFQPHLFSRTQDFMNGFAAELSQLDEVIVLPIYPARELPIPGVTSESVLEKVTQTNKRVIDSSAVLEALKDHSEGVILTIGAGDIDRIVEPLAEMLRKNGELN